MSEIVLKYICPVSDIIFTEDFLFMRIQLSEHFTYRKLLRFTLPSVIMMVCTSIYGVVDGVFVSNFVGSDAFAAVNLIMPFLMVLGAVGFMLGTGGSALVAYTLGAGNEKRANEIFSLLIYVLIGLGAVFTIGGIALLTPMSRLLGADETMLPVCVNYGRIVLLGLIPYMLQNTFQSFLVTAERPQLGLYVTIAAGVTNIVLDALFVAVLQWGVEGAALATILSQTLSALLAFRKLTHTGHSYRLSWRQVRFHGDMLRQVVYLGIPSGVQNSVISLANVIVQANINAFGSAAMAGCGAYSKIEGFAFLPVSCFSMALATFVSQNIGARRYDRVRSGIRFGLLCSPLLAEAIGLGIFVLSPLLVAAFNSSPEVIAYGVADARTVSLFYFLLAFSHCCAGILRGTGRPIIPMAIMLATWCALRIAYITAVTHFIPDIRVIYWAYPLTWFLGGLLFAVCLLRLRFPPDAALETYK